MMPLRDHSRWKTDDRFDRKMDELKQMTDDG